mmetsp:Transcript_21304/g.51492  ORF Transcript_21304/g.51492 Transcript_21304/m.51492 type:complete len:180 (+) Transcript_21304:217-756(+)
MAVFERRNMRAVVRSILRSTAAVIMIAAASGAILSVDAKGEAGDSSTSTLYRHNQHQHHQRRAQREVRQSQQQRGEPQPQQRGDQQPGQETTYWFDDESKRNERKRKKGEFGIMRNDDDYGDYRISLFGEDEEILHRRLYMIKHDTYATYGLYQYRHDMDWYGVLCSRRSCLAAFKVSL